MKTKKNPANLGLTITLRCLNAGKYGEYAVYRPGIGTEYFTTEAQAIENKKLCEKWSCVNAMILTKNHPIFACND